MNDPSLTRFQRLMKTLGPGLVFAGTSIGVSHVVQSTRAGALFGFGLLWAVIFANIFKFPFFEFAPRYVAATGDHLLHGYRKVGKWAFYLFFVLSLCTMLPIQAGVSIVTVGLLANLFNWTHPPVILSALLLGVCTAILLLGRYPVLDKLMKVMIIVLGVSTVFAFSSAVVHGSEARPEYLRTFDWNIDLAFLIALMGWMPTTLEIGVWHSFWSVERKKETNYTPRMKESLFDFHLGYWGTMVMAIFFLGLGALVMYATGETFSDSAVGFTGQVINLYTKALGDWSYPVIVAAATTTMFSTTISCLDAFPRVGREALIMIKPEWKEKESRIYTIWIICLAVAAVFIIGVFVEKIKDLIDFATTLAFVATPVFAYLNLRVITHPHVPEEHRPSKGLVSFSWFCIVLLTAFSVLFIVWRFFLR